MTYKRPFPLRRAGHWLAHRIVLASAVCLLAGSLAGSAGGQAPADQPPPETEGVGVTEHLDARLPLDLTFLDEEGRTVRLGDYFEGRKPVILNLVYFSCPMLCTLVLNGVVENMTALKWDLGKQYENVTVSFDPRETPELAKAKKQTYLASYGRPGGDAGWHFLTGTQQNINVLTGAVGFGYRWDPAGNQFVHPAVITSMASRDTMISAG